ncbi:hypothetical protein LRD18_12925, partial [Halorhodospira halochloris]|uniref:hypothetical protein n=1 Tax=Halorhodospira halochloris TaxID=1052 RepID=UPI001EE8B8FE
ICTAVSCGCAVNHQAESGARESSALLISRVGYLGYIGWANRFVSPTGYLCLLSNVAGFRDLFGLLLHR